MDFQPYLIAVNLTRRCNLACAHCYLDAGGKDRETSEELDTQELTALFDVVSRRADGTLVVLTGGEPLLRKDLPELVAAGNERGLRMVLGTNGLLLDARTVTDLSDCGLQGVGISLDNLRPEEHELFRGVPGAWGKTVSAIRACRESGLHVQLHTTITSKNMGQLGSFVQFSLREGVSILNFFFLVCTGRGQWLTDITPSQYEAVLQEIACLQQNTRGLMIQARCAPHFKRILYQQDPRSPFTRATGYDGGGCPAATHYCRIDPVGNVTPCPYMENSAGNIRDSSFWEIWDHSPLFKQFRTLELKGRCGSCEYRSLCGGCRARAQEHHGNLMAEDPTCTWQPASSASISVEIPSGRLDDSVRWTPEAKERLGCIPVFLRGMIRKRLEEKAKAQGIDITPEFMAAHRKQREQELGIKFQ